MSTVLNDELLLTELDYVRLSRLNDGHLPPDLSRVLDAADLVPAPEIPETIVTMYSRVQVRDRDSGESQEITVCYPIDASLEKGFISVLSPIGAALIGRRVGSAVYWTPPAGKERSMEIQSMLYQPEAHGDYVT
ncbi:GreA/GreB family elongation factor [beta proteobacterium MWH-UniP1]